MPESILVTDASGREVATVDIEGAIGVTKENRG
jgi:hypothetical protein